MGILDYYKKKCFNNLSDSTLNIFLGCLETKCTLSHWSSSEGISVKKRFGHTEFMALSVVLWSFVFVLIWLTSAEKVITTTGLVALLLGNACLGWILESSVLNELNKQVRIRVFVQNLFGENWTATVLLHRDGSLTAPEKAEERVLFPYDKFSSAHLSETALGFPRYIKKYKGAGEARVAVGVMMLDRLYTVPLDFGYDEKYPALT